MTIGVVPAGRSKRRIRPAGVVAAIVIPLVFFPTAPARATSFFNEALALAYVQGPSFVIEDNPGILENSDTEIANQATAVISSSSASASANGHVQVGAIGASAAVSSTWSILPPDDAYFPEGSARARSAWSDDITIVGPAGQSAMLDVTYALTSSLSATAGLYGYGKASVGMELGVALQPGDFVYYPSLNASLDSADGANGSSNGERTVSVLVTAGQRVGLTSMLSAAATARQGGSGLANASSTGRTFLAFGTTGFSYVADSGHDFSRPVPEPGSGLLVGLGLLALARRRSEP